MFFFQKLEIFAINVFFDVKWMECYLDSLTEKEKSRVCYAESNTSFCFSAGEIVSSIGKVTIPAIIGSKSVTVEVDLVDKDIPLLLSDESLKKANTSINTIIDPIIY